MHILLRSLYCASAALLAALILSLPPGVSSAQDADPVDRGFEITRDPTELPGLIRDRQPDAIDTALVLTHQGGPRAVASCVAFDANGEQIGRAWVRVPSNGVRVLLASDVAAGGAFVGSLRCIARGHLVGSAFIIGPGLTGTTVHNALRDGQSRIRVQAVVAR